MSLLDLLRGVRRHLVVFLALILVTAAASSIVWMQTPVTYQSQSTVAVLLPNVRPGEDGRPVPVNPWQDFGAMSAQVAASILSSVVSSAEFQERLRGEGVTSTTSAEVPPYGGEVVLVLTSVNPRAEPARADLEIVQAELEAELRQRQLATGAPEHTLLTMQGLTAPSPATALVSERTELVGVTAGIGLIISFAAVIILEQIRRNRARGRPPGRRRPSGGRRRAAPPGSADSADQRQPELQRDPTRRGDADHTQRIPITTKLSPPR